MRSVMRVRSIVATCVAAVVVATGCGGTEHHVIEMRNFAFDPPAVVVRPGDTIEFVNRDVVPHTATADDGRWDSGHVAADSSWSIVVTDRGRASYLCTLHPTMVGTIEVR